MKEKIYYADGTTAVVEHPDPEPLPPSPEERLAALEDAVDTLILDTLGGV